MLDTGGRYIILEVRAECQTDEVGVAEARHPRFTFASAVHAARTFCLGNTIRLLASYTFGVVK